MMKDYKQLETLLLSYKPQNEAEQAAKRQMLEHLTRSSLCLTREDSVAHFTASAWVVNPDRNMVLMAYHNIYKSWAWLGGHADGDGNLLRVAEREAREETSVENLALLCDEPVSLETLSVQEHIKRGALVAPHLHFNLTYLFEAPMDSRVSAKLDENSGVSWRTESQILSETNEEQMIPVYKKLLAAMKRF